MPLNACVSCGLPTQHRRYCGRCARAHNATDASRKRSTTNVSRTKRARLREHAWAAYDGCCGRCGQPIDPDQPWDLGHIVAHRDGGQVTPDNVRPEHRRCNRGAR